MPNFLVSSAGRRGHLVKILQSVAASTGGGRVVGIDASPMSAAGHLADAFEVVPRLNDSTFVDAVFDVCSRYSITHVVPTIDTELPIYAKYRDFFADEGVTVWASSPDVVVLGADKWLLHKWLTKHGFDTPTTVDSQDLDRLETHRRLIAKPRHGSASIGVRYFDNTASVRVASLADDYIVQEVATGYEVTSDFAVDGRGQIRGLGMRRRLEVRAGEVAKAVTVENSRVRAAVERLADELPGPYGVLNVQTFVDDESGRVSVIEVNPRFGGGFPLTWHAGGALPLALLDSSLPRADARPGVTMLRWDDAVFLETTELPS